MYLRQRCSDGAVNKTILKPRLAAAAGRQYIYVRFSRRKIPRSSVHTLSEKAIRFRRLDYNPDRGQKLTSSSMSRHLSTRNISSKYMHAFFSNLANRQTDRQTNKQTRAKTFDSTSNRTVPLLCPRSLHREYYVFILSVPLLPPSRCMSRDNIGSPCGRAALAIGQATMAVHQPR